MKIWKAELVLFYNDNDEYETKFYFELQEEDYEVNKHTNDEWTYFKNWISSRIPMNMIIERYYDNYKIIQGFDYELSEKELIQLEKNMRDIMQKQLDYDKELYLKKYEKKLQVINKS